MTPEHVRSVYRRMIDEVGEPVMIRRYTGLGINHPRFDVEVMARVTGYQPNELVGGVNQGDRRIIVLVEDLLDAQFALPVTASDKVVVRGKEMAIISPDDSTRRIAGVLIAYDIQARG